MHRRALIAALGGAAVWPISTFSQPSQIRLIGVLMASKPDDAISEARLKVFRDSLAELGWAQGRNIRFEVRHFGGLRDEAQAGAAELVKLTPNVIFAYGSSSLAALTAATQSIPIVFAAVNDPVAQGYVPNIEHPGGNITGFSFIDYSMIGKALGFLKQMVPAMTRVGLLFNPDDYPYYEVYLRSFLKERATLSLDVTAMRVHGDAEINSGIAQLAALPGRGLIALPSAFVLAHRYQVIEQALRYRLPLIVHLREAVVEGG